MVVPVCEPPFPVRSSREQTFVRRLLRWYRRRGRALPWRRTRDPYRILVSEVMLQQTQVERVIPKYREFLRRYPSIETLARAQVQEVREVWYPLGYNIRPVRLWAIANDVVSRYDGRIPDAVDRLLALKGIGPYTAGAVLAFAYGQRVPVVDTNVRRVLQRVFYGRRVPDRLLWRLAARLLPRQAYDFNQALMDLGAVVCTARAPRCLACPLRDCCRSYPRLAAAARRAARAPRRERPRAGGTAPSARG
jgi:A/G-specific adenine glycosylase